MLEDEQTSVHLRHLLYVHKTVTVEKKVKECRSQTCSNSYITYKLIERREQHSVGLATPISFYSFYSADNCGKSISLHLQEIHLLPMILGIYTFSRPMSYNIEDVPVFRCLLNLRMFQQFGSDSFCEQIFVQWHDHSALHFQKLKKKYLQSSFLTSTIPTI